MPEEIKKLKAHMIRSRTLIAFGYIALGFIYIWLSSGLLSEQLAQQFQITIAQVEMIKGFAFVLVSGVLFLYTSRYFDMKHLESYRELLKSRRHLAELKHFERLGAIAGGLSHDLRNLLQVLQFHVHELRNGFDSEVSAETQAEKLESQSQRLLEMSEALTEAFTPGDQETEPELIRLDEFIHRELELVRPLHNHGEIIFRNSLGVTEIKADRLQLHRLTLNLLQNAARAADDADCIEVVLGRSESGEIRLTVSNTGDPIPAEIVEQFNQELELSQAGSGHGWGLNIIRSAASELGASIEAHAAEEEGGAQFEVSFDSPATAEQTGRSATG